MTNVLLCIIAVALMRIHAKLSSADQRNWIETRYGILGHALKELWTIGAGIALYELLRLVAYVDADEHWLAYWL